MHINLTLLGQALTFAVFVWFTLRYIWPPLLTAIQQREKTIADGLAAGERGRKHLAQANQQAEACLIDARLNAQKIIEEATAQAQQLLETAKQQLNQQIAQQLQQADAQIAQKWAILKQQLSAELAQLVIISTEQACKLQAKSQQTQQYWIQQIMATQ
jgi:F-type H+-transporting ATPase subunit b